jgi:hypothetical protein
MKFKMPKTPKSLKVKPSKKLKKGSYKAVLSALKPSKKAKKSAIIKATIKKSSYK